jgi:hypothetical protein
MRRMKRENLVTVHFQYRLEMYHSGHTALSLMEAQSVSEYSTARGLSRLLNNSVSPII